MFERFTDDARRAVVLAQEQCAELKHDRIGAEHLLLGVAAVPAGTGARALADVGSGLPALRRALLLTQPGGERSPAGHIPFTPAAKQVMERSLRESLRRRAGSISSGHLLVALLAAGNDGVRRTLDTAGVDTAALSAAVDARLEQEEPPEAVAEPDPDSDRLARIEAALADVTDRLDRIERLLGGGESAAQS